MQKPTNIEKSNKCKNKEMPAFLHCFIDHHHDSCERLLVAGGLPSTSMLLALTTILTGKRRQVIKAN